MKQHNGRTRSTAIVVQRYSFHRIRGGDKTGFKFRKQRISYLLL